MRNTILLLIAGFLTGCGPSDPKTALLERAFEAIQDGDWETYSGLTITLGDFSIKEQKLTPLKAGQSYAASLRKKARERHREEFDLAHKGGEFILDFKNASFVSKGTLLGKGLMQSLGEKEIPFEAYSLIVNIGEAETDTADLDPEFIVVPWDSGYRIYELRFPRTE